MTASRMLLLVVVALCVPGSPVSAASPVADATVTVDQRAQAQLGLGRVARDRGDWKTAHRHFVESDRLRPFDHALREEHFWIAVRVDAAAAMSLARRLAADGRMSRQVSERWVAMTAESSLEDAFDAIAQVARRHPDPKWTAAWASLGLRAEASGHAALAAEAWARVPSAERESRADWDASALRVEVARTSRAAMAARLEAFVQRHPEDAGMRRLAVEALADLGQPARALSLFGPLLTTQVTSDIRRAATLALAAGDLPAARRAFERLAATRAATTADVTALAGVLATQRDAAALRALFIDRPAPPCASDRVDALLASGDDRLVTDLVPSLDATCETYPVVAAVAARTWLARGQADIAERWVRAVAPTQVTDAHRVLLARALSARGAWADVEAVLAGASIDPASEMGTEASGLRVWALAALGRPSDAWNLATRTQSPDAATPQDRAGWAALAFRAGDRASASRLAQSALGSPRDDDARAVLASLAAAEGRPAATRAWLAPVATSLRESGHVRLWLDATAALDGAAAALEEARRFTSIIERDAELLASRAVWSAQLGDLAAASRDADRVRALSPARGAMLDVAARLASGDASAAWQTLMASQATIETSPNVEDWKRLRLDVAVAVERWDEATQLLSAADPWLSSEEQALTAARIALGRTGQLPRPLRAALDAAVSSDRHAAPARVVLAAADVAEGDPRRAIDRLVGASDLTAARRACADVRSVLAQAVLQLERPSDVLALVSEAATEPPALRVLRARALGRLGRVDEARADLAELAAATGRADAYLAWADTAADAVGRAAILREAAAAHPQRLDVSEHYLAALVEAGQFEVAAPLAARTLERAPASRMAWQSRVRLAAPAGDAALLEALHDAHAALAGDAERVSVLGEAVGQLSHVPAPVLTQLVEWLRAYPDDAGAAKLQVRLAVSAGAWEVAEDALGRLQRVAPGDPPTRRLQAQVTAWSGRHAEAVPLYAAYLEDRPDDHEAWREYARLLTWREDAARAVAAYARLQAMTTAPAVQAEARTKQALLQRDWPAAARAAAVWKSLEPASLDAAVDLAHALEQAGRATPAADAWQDVARRPGLPDVVQRSLAARGARTVTTASGVVDLASADAFGGRRLVETRTHGVSAAVAARDDGAVWLDVDAGQGRLVTAAGASTLRHGDVGLRFAPGRGVQAGASLGAVQGGGTELTRVEAQLFAPVARRAGIDVSASRLPFWENATTVGAGLTASTVGVGARLLAAGPVDAQIRASFGEVSDGNRRRQVDLSLGRQFGRGTQTWHVRASGFVFGFADQTAAYFSPAGFGRVDVEAGLTRWLGEGARVRDARQAIRAGGGLGVDTDGRPYVLGSAGLVLPLGRALRVSADGRWTSSSVFSAWSVSAGLHVGLGTSAVGRASATTAAPIRP